MLTLSIYVSRFFWGLYLLLDFQVFFRIRAAY